MMNLPTHIIFENDAAYEEQQLYTILFYALLIIHIEYWWGIIYMSPVPFSPAKAQF